MFTFIYIILIQIKMWCKSLTMLKIYIYIIYILYFLTSLLIAYSFIKLFKHFPGFSTIFVPTPYENSLPLRADVLGENWRQRYLPYVPENIYIPEGGILTVRRELGPSYGNGIEIILPGASHLDPHLYAVELTRTQLISYANIRRMPCTSELASYMANPDYFRRINCAEDSFNFFYTYMSDNAPDQILTDAVGRTYFIVDDATIVRFTAQFYPAGWKAYDLVMLFNHIDSTRYGMVCRTREIAEHVIAQNNMLFEQGLKDFKEGVQQCAEWSLGFTFLIALSIGLTLIKIYWPMPLPIIG